MSSNPRLQLQNCTSCLDAIRIYRKTLKVTVGHTFPVMVKDGENTWNEDLHNAIVTILNRKEDYPIYEQIVGNLLEELGVVNGLGELIIPGIHSGWRTFMQAIINIPTDKNSIRIICEAFISAIVHASCSIAMLDPVRFGQYQDVLLQLDIFCNEKIISPMSKDPAKASFARSALASDLNKYRADVRNSICMDVFTLMKNGEALRKIQSVRQIEDGRLPEFTEPQPIIPDTQMNDYMRRVKANEAIENFPSIVENTISGTIGNILGGGGLLGGALGGSIGAGVFIEDPTCRKSVLDRMDAINKSKQQGKGPTAEEIKEKLDASQFQTLEYVTSGQKKRDVAGECETTMESTSIKASINITIDDFSGPDLTDEEFGQILNEELANLLKKRLCIKEYKINSNVTRSTYAVFNHKG